MAHPTNLSSMCLEKFIRWINMTLKRLEKHGFLGHPPYVSLVKYLSKKLEKVITFAKTD